MGSKYRTQDQPVRNYRCNERVNSRKLVKVLNKCSRELKNIKISELLGEGGFGTVHKGVGTYKNKMIDIAVKKVECESVDEMNYEIEFSYYMGEYGLGPKMYDAFFIKLPKGRFIEYIIMEPFDMDGGDALMIGDNFDRQNVIKQMIDLLELQVMEYGMNCIDIKPGNFVYRDSDKVVKLIDFGSDWCGFNQIKNSDRDEFLVLILLQLYLMIREATGNFMMLLPFHKHRIFRKLTSDKKFRDKIIRQLKLPGEGFEELVGTIEYYCDNIPSIPRAVMNLVNDKRIGEKRNDEYINQLQLVVYQPRKFGKSMKKSRFH